ncbi:MAG: peptidoglycan DD-metalloendopeptidase family protein [Beijerinckiaceae bacterium]|nr:peptidoglycan DD-metalloendopeptidase family protein [Beijerinckiaceae bacterium]
MAGALALLAAPGLQAQAPPPAGEAKPSADQLRGVETEIEKSGFEQRRLAYEIENLSTEAQKLRQSMIEVARRIQDSEQALAEQQQKLDGLTRQEQTLRRSLQSRERVTAEVLAAMQRIGRKPPPALLVAPEDVLSAMRAAILLGGVLPDMRDEALILVADLKTLSELRRQNAELVDQMRDRRDRLTVERTRLAGLVETRQSQLSVSQAQLDSEKQRVAVLTREARSLRDLIARNENDMLGDPRAVEIARRAPAPPRSGQQVATLRPEAGREAPRLQPRQGFAERRGQMALPASGIVARAFGAPDGLGGTERGITIASNPGAVVTAPADGWVHFAAPYRGYGQLLIINGGNGYHVVLAGMERLAVEMGQFVLAGEPVGFLPAGRDGSATRGDGQGPPLATGPGNAQSPAAVPNGAASGGSPGAGGSLGASGPALYVEFRKDGSPVDPSPFWSTQSAEKARG